MNDVNLIPFPYYTEKKEKIKKRFELSEDLFDYL